jgi:hypothetical protein
VTPLNIIDFITLNMCREAQIMVFLVRQFSLASCYIIGPYILHSRLYSSTLWKPPSTFVPHSAAPLLLPLCFIVAPIYLKRHLEVKEYSHIN